MNKKVKVIILISIIILLIVGVIIGIILFNNNKNREIVNNDATEIIGETTDKILDLEQNNIEFDDRHIVENNPTKDELRKWIKQSGYDIKKFFNTSGMKYKELNLKEKLPNMTDEEKIEILSTDGMLVKRPLIITEDLILVGFKEKEWEQLKNIK